MQHVATVQIIVQGSKEQAQEEVNRLASTLEEAGFDVLGWDVEGELEPADEGDGA